MSTRSTFGQQLCARHCCRQRCAELLDVSSSSGPCDHTSFVLSWLPTVSWGAWGV